MRRCSADIYCKSRTGSSNFLFFYWIFACMCANLVYSIREGTYVFLCVSMIRALIKGLCENMRSYVKVNYYGTRFLKIKLLLLLIYETLNSKKKKVETCFPSFFPISLLHVNSKHKTRILLIYSSSRRFSNP